MENTIFIQNLQRDIDVAKLCDEFKAFGKILSARIECDDNMKFIGDAHITFEDYSSALNSVKFMNGKKIKNKSIHVSFEVENDYFKKVYVKNISRDWDECDLLKHFESIGTVEEAKLSEDNEGNSNGFGYVVFKTHIGAKKAIEYWNGKILNGKTLIVERFKGKSERENFMMSSLEYAEEVLKNSTQRNNLFIKNLSKDMKDDDLKNLLRKYGDLLSVKIAVDDSGISKGFGFASFKSKEDAEKALKRLNGTVLYGRRLEVNFKQDRQARTHYMELKNKDRAIKAKQYKQRSQSTSAMQFLPSQVTGHTLMKI